RLGEARWSRAVRAHAGRRVSHLPEKREVLNGGVVEAECHTDAGLAGSAEDLAEDSLAERRRIGQPRARPEIVVAGGGECGWNYASRATRVAGDHPSFGRRGINHRLHPGDDGLNLVLRVVPRHVSLPAQAVV